ncbi:EamA family transporter [Desulfopila sp. IMCC35008]|uniref:EamA family transporter n=1 Tax=Desulfopila sp. IMCC35008 TaxID=2653858 RepID=UPI0013CFF4EE|nr:EamA family transporter [Desulfopila sp. IMCC35008]
MGEIAALIAALFWAVASTAFADIGRHISAIHLNLVKGGLAILLMGIVLFSGSLFTIPSLSPATLTSISGYGWLLLCLSGIVGIAFGDSAYFACIKRIGPQKGLMLESTAPLLTALLALVLYEEYLPVASWFGIMLTTLGVIVVIRFSSGAKQYQNSKSGIVFGLLASCAQATGIVLSRMALDGEDIEPLASGLVRLSAGLFILLLWTQITTHLGIASKYHTTSISAACRVLLQEKLFSKLFTAMFFGTFIAIWLQQLSVKYTSAGIAQTLFATCPLIGTIIAVRRGYSQPAAVWGGLLLGLIGVGMLFLL